MAPCKLPTSGLLKWPLDTMPTLGPYPPHVQVARYPSTCVNPPMWAIVMGPIWNPWTNPFRAYFSAYLLPTWAPHTSLGCLTTV